MYQSIRVCTALCLFVLFSACSLDDDSASSLVYHPSVTDDFEPVSVSGVASKGILSNARVKVYAADDGIGRHQILGMGYTNEQGEYAIDIPLLYRGPMVIQVETDRSAPTLMACDSVKGCGELGSVSGEYDTDKNGLIDFGERFPIGAGFKLNAAHFALGNSNPINLHITPITHLVEALAERYGDAYSQASLRKANSHVANLFGLTGQLSRIQPLDLTREDIEQIDDLERVRYSILAASFAGLTTHLNELSSVVDVYTGIFLSNDGQFPLIDDSIFGAGFERFLGVAVDLSEHLQSKGDAYAQSSLLLKMDLIEVRARAESLNITEAIPSESVELDGLGRAKGFVVDLLDWHESLALSAQNGVGFIDKTSELKAMAENAQVAPAFLSAAKYTPILAIMPLISSNEEAIDFFCDQMTGTLGYFCVELLANYDMQNLDCGAQSNPICNRLSKKLVVPIPTLEEGLSADYEVLAHTVHVYGTAYNHAVDLTFRLSDYDLAGKISVVGEGEMVNEVTRFSMLGRVSVDADNGYEGVSELAVSASEANGDDYALSLRYGDGAMAIVEFEQASQSGNKADVTVFSGMSDWGARSDRVEIESQGKHFVLSRVIGHENQFIGLSQDGIEINLDLSDSRDGEVGKIVFGDASMAAIVRENGGFFVDFNDGAREDISALIL